jgi:hypothetical protein
LARDEAKRGSEMIPQSELLAKIEMLQRKVDDLTGADQDARFSGLTERVGELEKTNSLEARFTKLAEEVKRGSEMIPQSELLAKIDRLERQLDNPKAVAEPDARFFELAERVGALEQTSSLEARFSKFADQVKRDSAIPQDELLVKVDGLQRQVDDLKRVADSDVRFHDLAERVGELEKTVSLEARFNKLADEVKRGPEIPLSELLAKFDGLQRQVDDLKKVADLDPRFRELTDRVTELEKTNSLEARFAKLAHEVKNGSELPQSELVDRIDGLQRQLDDLKKIANQRGPQGPPGPPGKLPRVKEYAAGRVHYESDVVTHAGALWQAQCDTVHSPPHDDWTLLARPGRDATTPTVCGTYDARGKYKKLDIVVSEGAAFIAKCDNPGICPGDGWQLMSRQGRQGRKGEDGARGPRGEKGEKGEPGTTIHSWQLDRQRYRISPLMSDGTVGPMMELRPMFERFLNGTSD